MHRARSPFLPPYVRQLNLSRCTNWCTQLSRCDNPKPRCSTPAGARQRNPNPNPKSRATAQQQQQQHTVYSITCILTGRTYVGISVDPVKRYQQHAHQPPQHMRQDVQQHTPLVQHFELNLLHTYASRTAAEVEEQRLIAAGTLTGPAGYNKLPAAPHRSPQFWAMHTRGKAKTAWF